MDPYIPHLLHYPIKLLVNDVMEHQSNVSNDHLQLLSNEISIFQVDCVGEGKSTCSKYGVSGYPTIKIFRDGTPAEYDGPREATGIVAYMRKQAGPASVELKDKAHFDKKMDSAEDNLVVGKYL